MMTPATDTVWRHHEVIARTQLRSTRGPGAEAMCTQVGNATTVSPCVEGLSLADGPSASMVSTALPNSGTQHDTMSCTFTQTETEELPCLGEVTIHVDGYVDAYRAH
jgi:hypothetical protein